jgi:transaldolase
LHALDRLKVKVFADGADLRSILQLSRRPQIRGFTTNPSLLKKAGIFDYQAFARAVLARIPDLPVSFEVLSDDFKEMKREALQIAGWGTNVYVKIPVMNSRGESTSGVLRSLAAHGVKLNVTALLTIPQISATAEALEASPAACISVFAGRIADTGRDPIPVMSKALEILAPYPQLELIWASPREVLNIVQADAIGCHIITVTNDLLKKVALFGKDLDEYSLETVRMFSADARAAGLKLHGHQTSQQAASALQAALLSAEHPVSVDV